MVCNRQSTTDTYNEFIRQINKLEKTFVAKVDNGKLAMDPSQVFNLPMPCSTPNAQSISQEQDVNADSLSTYSYNLSENYPQRNSSERKSIDEMSAQSSQQLVLATQFPERTPPVVVLRSFVRYGEISCRKGDLQIWDPEFQVPDHILKTLHRNLRNIPLIGVLVIKHSDGRINYYGVPNLEEFSLDGEIELAAHEQLILKTRVCNGKVSFEDVAVQFKYGNVRIPQYIIDIFRVQEPNGDLYIISDNSGNFRSVVKRKRFFKKVERAAKELF